MLTGMGNFVQTLVMVVFMAAVHQTGRDLDPQKLEIVWRGQYAIACIVLAGLTVYRLWKLQESGVWGAAAGTAGKAGLHVIPTADLNKWSASEAEESGRMHVMDGTQEGVATESVRLADGHSAGVDAVDETEVPRTPGGGVASPIPLFFKTQWHRLVGTSVGWAVWDVAFYGGCDHCCYCSTRGVDHDGSSR